jgi:hypothetical protein
MCWQMVIQYYKNERQHQDRQYIGRVSVQSMFVVILAHNE